MTNRGTRGAYRKEDRVSLPQELQKELVERAAAKYGNCQELARHLSIPKSSVHYYKIGRLTMPISVLEKTLKIANDADLSERVKKAGIEKDRTWANEYAVSVYREMCREKLRLPTKEDLERNDDLRRKAAAIVSYVMAEGSVWLQKEKWGECVANITFAAHETDLYEHFRSLCKEVFRYDIGPPQKPGNGAFAIRGFIYSRFVAEWLIANCVMPGEKSARCVRLPSWVMLSADEATWRAAIQPWCDGEGCVSFHWRSKFPSFRIAQSRHTDLNTSIVPAVFNAKDRGIGLGTMRRLEVDGEDLVSHCIRRYRSEVLDDVRDLADRLGLHPRISIGRLHLKDDGRWSCIWTLGFGVEATSRLLDEGIIIGERKRRKAKRRPEI